LQFQYANALALPFADNSIDYVHSSAVWEHVGCVENQRKMLFECLRVADKGVFLTTPNRWFPVEFHSQLPLVHWLPKKMFRWVLRRTKYFELADEAVLNLLSAGEIKTLSGKPAGWDIRLQYTYVLGWPSNIILTAKRRSVV